MRHKGFTWVEGLILFAVIFVIAAVLFPFFAKPRESRRPICQPNLKQIGLGIMQYTQDYDEKLPPVALVSAPNSDNRKYYGWADAVFPYVKSWQIYHCVLEGNTNGPNSPRQQNYIDYWMNSNLSALTMEKIKEPAVTILSGDGNGGADATNARYNLSALPQNWIDDRSSPAYRHVEGANYSFADGHVKWLKPGNIKNTSITKDGPTFSFK